MAYSTSLKGNLAEELKNFKEGEKIIKQVIDKKTHNKKIGLQGFSFDESPVRLVEPIQNHILALNLKELFTGIDRIPMDVIMAGDFVKSLRKGLLSKKILKLLLDLSYREVQGNRVAGAMKCVNINARNVINYTELDLLLDNKQQKTILLVEIGKEADWYSHPKSERNFADKAKQRINYYTPVAREILKFSLAEEQRKKENSKKTNKKNPGKRK